MINSLYIFLYRSTRTVAVAVAVAVEEGKNYFTVVKFIDMEDTDQEIVQIFHLQFFFFIDMNLQRSIN